MQTLTCGLGEGEVPLMTRKECETGGGQLAAKAPVGMQAAGVDCGDWRFVLST